MTFLDKRREDRERLELSELAAAATKAIESNGRATEEEPDQYRTIFERDRDRIIYSKAFRRLKHKTQVFINPDGDHYVTRLTHTVKVTQVGRAISAALGLNPSLTEAICLGHDVGHSPFGHTGEEALTPYVQGEWLHSQQSVRVLSVIEPLNLSQETLDGIRAHSWRIEPPPETPEGMVCRYADRISYLTHDVQDAIRAGVLNYGDLPRRSLAAFGHTATDWIGTMIESVVSGSNDLGKVSMQEGLLEELHELREFMFERVYLRPESERQKERAIGVIRDLATWFSEHPGEIPAGFSAEDDGEVIRAIDYVAGMTDRYALKTHDRLFRPTLFE